MSEQSSAPSRFGSLSDQQVKDITSALNGNSWEFPAIRLAELCGTEQPWYVSASAAGRPGPCLLVALLDRRIAVVECTPAGQPFDRQYNAPRLNEPWVVNASCTAPLAVKRIDLGEVNWYNQGNFPQQEIAAIVLPWLVTFEGDGLPQMRIETSHYSDDASTAEQAALDKLRNEYMSA